MNSLPENASSNSSNLAAESDGIIVEEDGSAVAYMFLRSLAEEMSHGSVDMPCFPDVLIRIRKALANPKTTTAQLAKIIEVEPLLVTRLITTANSAMHNPSGRAVRELQLAMTRLGEQAVQSLAVAFSVQQIKKIKALQPIAKELNALWHRNIGIAVLCRLIAPRAKIHADTGFLTGLLSGIGTLYILTRAANFSMELARSAAFLETVGSWHTAIGKEVLSSWGFTDEALAVGNQEDYSRESEGPADLTDVLVASIVLADALMKNEPIPKLISEVSAFGRLGLMPNSTSDLVALAKTQLQETYLALNV